MVTDRISKTVFSLTKQPTLVGPFPYVSASSSDNYNLDATIIKLFHLRVNVLDYAILRAILLALTMPFYLHFLFFDQVSWQ